MRTFIRLLLALIVVGLLSFIGAAYWLTRPVTVAEETFVEIKHRASTRAIADQLTALGVLRSPYGLIVMRALHPHAQLQAGEYEFDGTLTPSQVFETLRRGLVFYEEVTVPEGSNLYDIAALLDQTDTIDSSDFLTVARDPALIKDLDPAAPSLEGYLFPSTYRVTHKSTAKDLCRVMTQEFRHEWSLLGGGRKDLHAVVTVASLVEKETAIAAERALVAAVF